MDSLLNTRTFATASLLVLALRAFAQPAPTEFSPVLTLAQARAAALRDNPALKAAEAQWEANRGAETQAHSHLNPSLEFRREDFGGSLPAIQQAPQDTLSVSQTFRTAGKHSAQKEAAKWASEAARLDYQRRRLDLLAEVDSRFAEMLGTQERERLCAENLETAGEVASAVSALVDAGEVSPVESSRADNDRDLAEIDLENARRDVEVTRRELARLLGQEEPRFARAEGTLAEEAAFPDAASASNALQSLPDLARWDAETRRLGSSLRLAKRSPWPDLSFAVGVRKYTTTQERTYVAGIAFPLPIFNRERGAIVEASARLDQGLLERQAEEVRLKNALTSARLVLERANAEVRTLKGRVLPNAHKIFEALNEGYLRGKFRLLDLLEARRSLASVRLRYVDSLVRLNTAKAHLERLLATAKDLTDGAKP